MQRFNTPLENASLSLQGPGNLVCAHSTTILTNHESSELVGERIFYALQYFIMRSCHNIDLVEGEDWDPPSTTFNP